MRIPIGGFEQDYDSKKSRATAVNLIPVAGKGEGFKTFQKAPGLLLKKVLDEGAIRSNLFVNSGYLWVVSGSKLYRVDTSYTVTEIGSVGVSTGEAQILANSIPNNNQLTILAGDGNAFTYQAGGSLTQITDSDYYPSTYAAILNERVYFVRDGTPQFFGSAISNSQVFSSTTIGSATEKPGNLLAIAALKSALMPFSTSAIEIWQTYSDPDLPVRRVKDATIPTGIAAGRSLAELNDTLAWLASDLTVKAYINGQVTTISDLAFTQRVAGNGTLTKPGFSTVADAIGFFVDEPHRKIYYITFPTEGYTWGYDFSTNLPHLRESWQLGRWIGRGAVRFNNKVVVAGYGEPNLYELDLGTHTENSEVMQVLVRTPAQSFEHNVSITKIEIDMEVGFSNDALLHFRFSRDGGNTWINRETMSFGGLGNYSRKITLLNFGRLVRHSDFVLEISSVSAARVQLSSIYMTANTLI